MEHDEEVKRHCATAYLEYIRALVVRIRSLQDEIEEKRALLEPSRSLYREAVSRSLATDAFENGIIGLQELIARFCVELAEYVEQQALAHEVLHSLSRAEYTAALTGYYVQGKSWDRVCADMDYTRDGMMKLRRRAILEVYDFMPESWRRDSIPNSDGAYR